MRVPFKKIFSDNEDGSFTTTSGIMIHGRVATGLIFRQGELFAGVDITQHAGRDLEVESFMDGIVEIIGAY